MPRGWGHAAPKERGRVERASRERGKDVLPKLTH